MNPEEIKLFFEQNVAGYIENLALGIIILVVGWVLIKIVKKGLTKALKRSEIDETISKFIVNVANVILLAALVIAVLNEVGVETASLLTVLGAAGLAIGLALQGSLSNLAAGVMLIIFRPFKVGQFVEAGGTMGSVNEIQIFNTIMSTPDNKVIIIPNSKIIGDTITNFTERDTRRMDLVFGIGYGDDIKKAKDIIEKVLKADERVLKDPIYTIGVLELADSSVNLAVRPWVKTSEYWPLYWDLMENMKYEFDANGISIPFPQRDVHLYQQNSN
ncbi:MAG: mechanosensitive ion channel protein [Melioribacteraceae bacterium]|nr:MAG: mechanosensitive ion channel protein [Melioribacteraceae bacterium]